MNSQFLQHGPLEQRIFEQLCSSVDFSLASGQAGALLFQACMHSAHPSPARRDNVGFAADRLIKSISNVQMPADLWSGIVGAAYALQYAKLATPGVLPDSVDGLLADLDDLFLNFVESSDRNIKFDLISGLAGYGAYALMRDNDKTSRHLYQAVEEKLGEFSTPVTDGLYWRTESWHVSSVASEEGRRRGHLDYGIAHGGPGVLLLLAAGLRHGLTADKLATEQTVRDGTRALLAARITAPDRSSFPYYDPQPHSQPSRLAWCYGDVSAAFALWGIASVLESPAIDELARSVVERRLQMPKASFGYQDAGLCHGQSGVRHLLQKIAAGRPVFDSHIAELRTEIRSQADLAYELHKEPGVLDGAAGILMAEVDAASVGRHAWDTCLCFGF